MLIVLFVAFWFVALAMVGTLGVPLADLFRRENEVKWWFGLPLLPPFLILTYYPLVFLGHSGFSAVETGVYTLAWFHVILAGILLYLGVSLAIVRGMRPGGATSRRVRTSLTASVVLVLLGVQPVLWGLLDEAWGILTSWLAVACMAGMIWIWTLNRRGPWRLTAGKRMSAALFVASMMQLGLGAAHMGFVLRLGYPESWSSFTLESSLMVAPVLVLLPLSLRFLSGPLPAAPLVFSGALAATLALPPISLALWNPWSGELPTWTNLLGDPGPSLRYARWVDCPRAPGDPTPCDSSWMSIHTAATPDTSLDRLPSNAQVLVNQGQQVVFNDWAHGNAETLTEVNGLAQLGDNPPVPLGSELHTMLDNLGSIAIPLEVERSPAWTVQDYVRICASYRWTCRLK